MFFLRHAVERKSEIMKQLGIAECYYKKEKSEFREKNCVADRIISL
jgi:hypothetical protein